MQCIMQLCIFHTECYEFVCMSMSVSLCSIRYFTTISVFGVFASAIFINRLAKRFKQIKFHSVSISHDGDMAFQATTKESFGFCRMNNLLLLLLL